MRDCADQRLALGLRARPCRQQRTEQLIDALVQLGNLRKIMQKAEPKCLGGGESPPAWTLTAAILGGTLAAGSHFTKAGTRMVLNTSPEPFSNWAASFGEDLLVGTMLYLALAYPIVFLIVLAIVLAMSIWLLPKLWRYIRAIVNRIATWFGHRPPNTTKTGDV